MTYDQKNQLILALTIDMKTFASFIAQFTYNKGSWAGMGKY